MECPNCGSLNFGPLTSVEIHPDRDQYESPIGTRGEWTATRLSCEVCHAELLLVVANNKGQLRVELVQAP